VAAERGRDLTGLSTPEVLARVHERCRRVLDEFGKEPLKPGFFGGMALAGLTRLLTQIVGPEGEHLAVALTGGMDGDVTFEQDVLLYRVARGEATMAEFIERFGHRAVGEMELATPRWREDPEHLEMVASHIRAFEGPAPEAMHGRDLERRRDAERRLDEALTHWGGSSLRSDIERELGCARELLPYRESGKHYLMMGYELIRLAVLELARRWDVGDDVFFLRLDELAGFEERRQELVEAAATRKVRWQSAKRLDLPDVVDSDRLERLGLPRVFESAAELEGDAVAAGVSTGTARIVFDPCQVGDLGLDYVLVCPSTDPGWTPLFLNACGLVVERGGMLSHGAIVARDFGIPAVVCPGATRLIADGATVQVDGDRGRIIMLEEG